MPKIEEEKGIEQSVYVNVSDPGLGYEKNQGSYRK